MKFNIQAAGIIFELFFLLKKIFFFSGVVVSFLVFVAGKIREKERKKAGKIGGETKKRIYEGKETRR